MRGDCALARRKRKQRTLKVNRLAIFLNLNSSIKVPMTTVWLAVLSARPRLEPTGASGGIGAKASAPTSARAKMQAFLYIVKLQCVNVERQEDRRVSKTRKRQANKGERTRREIRCNAKHGTFTFSNKVSEQGEQYVAMPSMVCTFTFLYFHTTKILIRTDLESSRIYDQAPY